MGWHKPILYLFVVLLSVSAARAQGGRARSDQEILIQLEKDWDAAFLGKDVKFIERVLADEFLATYDDGSRGDKARELALATEFDKSVESTMDEFTVKVYGDLAVVWLSRHLVGSSQGKLLELTFHFTDVFVWRDGRWQCVSSQSTRVAG